LLDQGSFFLEDERDVDVDVERGVGGFMAAMCGFLYFVKKFKAGRISLIANLH